jgi:hypothetical protein
MARRWSLSRSSNRAASHCQLDRLTGPLQDQKEGTGSEHDGRSLVGTWKQTERAC